MSGEIKIIKTGSAAPSPKPTPKDGAKTRKQHAHGKPSFGILKGGKTARSGPRFKAVKDPAKSPPVKQSKATLRILTDRKSVV